MINVRAEIIKMESPEVAEAFMKFKPMCDSFLKNPQRRVLLAIIKLVKSLPNEVIQELHTYLMFPFVVHLKSAKDKSYLLEETNRRKRVILKDDMKASLAEGVYEILSKIDLESADLFHKYYSLLIYQIFDKKSPNTVARVDEDCALKFVRAIGMLALKLTPEVRGEVYIRSNAPEIGQGIYLCVQIARSSRYKALRVEAIMCVMSLCTVHDELLKVELDSVQADKVGEVLMFFLPGLLGGLQEIAMGNPRQGITVTCIAVRAINHIICLVMHDRERKNSAANITEKHFVTLLATHKARGTQERQECDPFGKRLRHKGHAGMMEHLETARRDDEWYKAAADRLVILIKSLKPLLTHNSEKVRMEMIYLCWNILSCSVVNMRPSLRDLLEILVTLSEDEDEEISAASIRALGEYSNKSNNGKLLHNVLEENFYYDISKLPRCLNALDSGEHAAGLNLLKGYIRLLTTIDQTPQKLTEILTCSFILSRFVFVLIEIFKMECNGIKLLEEVVVRDMESQTLTSCPWKIFKNLQNDACVRIALDICHMVGASDSVEMVTDCLLEQFRENTEYKKEIILILNEIVTSPCKNKSSKEHLVGNLITMYIDIDNWYLPIAMGKFEKAPKKSETLDPEVYNPRPWTQERTYGLYEGATETRYTGVSYRPTEEENSDTEDECHTWNVCRTLTDARDNVIKICLMVEGIGKMALFLGDQFKEYLLKTLYLVLERAGSSNEMIHIAGMKALLNIAKACDTNDVTGLIKQNADYFTHHVNVKLRKMSENSGVLDVLQVVMRYSETAVLPCLYQIVDNVLNQCFKQQQHNMVLFLRLFHTFINYIKNKFPATKPEVVETLNSASKQDPSLTIDTVIEQIVAYHMNKSNSIDFSDDDFGKIADEMYKEDAANKLKKGIEEEATLQDPDKSEPPIHITMVVSVLKKTLNFIPSKDRDQKLLALNIVKEGIEVIKDWEDELLPLVHLVWSPLVNRFKETSQPLIINKAFQLLVTLAECSKDFIRARTIKEVMPVICDILEKSASDSHMKDVGSSYRFSQQYKLQLTLLEGLGKFCISLGLDEKQNHQVMTCINIYLSCKQPKPLQLACLNIFKMFIDNDPASTWLQLHSLWNDQLSTLPPPKEGFQTFSCVLNNPHRKMDYKQNVVLLLDYYKANRPKKEGK